MVKRLLVCMSVLLLLTGCASGGDSGEGEPSPSESVADGGETSSLPPVIKVAVQLDLAGEAAGALSERALNAAKLAVEEINASGELGDSKIEIVVVDTQGKPENYPVEYEKVLGQDISAIVGGVFSDGLFSVGDMVEEAGIPIVVTITIAGGIAEQGDYWFRTSTPSPVTWPLAIPRIIDEFQPTVVGELWQEDSATLIESHEAVQSALEETDVESIEQTMTREDTDFATQINALIEGGMDLFIINVDSGKVPPIAIQARQLGYTGQIVGNLGLQSKDVVDRCAEACAGAVFPTAYYSGSELASVQEFVAAYKEAYDIEPDVFAAGTYDGMRLVGEAIKAAGSAEPDAVREALAEISSWDGGMGAAEQDAEGAFVYEPIILRVTDDRSWEVVDF